MADVAKYSCVWRPVGAPHGHPALLFDRQYRLDLPLISFVKQAQRRLSPRSARCISTLSSRRPSLNSQSRGRRPAELEHNAWTGAILRAPGTLEEELGCIVRQHRLGFELVSLTARSPASVGLFLASVRFFFNVMREIGCYAGDNPFLDVRSPASLEVDNHNEDGLPHPGH